MHHWRALSGSRIQENNNAPPKSNSIFRRSMKTTRESPLSTPFYHLGGAPCDSRREETASSPVATGAGHSRYGNHDVNGGIGVPTSSQFATSRVLGYQLLSPQHVLKPAGIPVVGIMPIGVDGRSNDVEMSQLTTSQQSTSQSFSSGRSQPSPSPVEMTDMRVGYPRNIVPPASTNRKSLVATSCNQGASSDEPHSAFSSNSASRSATSSYGSPRTQLDSRQVQSGISNRSRGGVHENYRSVMFNLSHGPVGAAGKTPQCMPKLFSSVTRNEGDASHDRSQIEIGRRKENQSDTSNSVGGKRQSQGLVSSDRSSLDCKRNVAEIKIPEELLESIRRQSVELESERNARMDEKVHHLESINSEQLRKYEDLIESIRRADSERSKRFETMMESARLEFESQKKSLDDGSQRIDRSAEQGVKAVEEATKSSVIGSIKALEAATELSTAKGTMAIEGATEAGIAKLASVVKEKLAAVVGNSNQLIELPASMLAAHCRVILGKIIPMLEDPVKVMVEQFLSSRSSVPTTLVSQSQQENLRRSNSESRIILSTVSKQEFAAPSPVTSQVQSDYVENNKSPLVAPTKPRKQAVPREEQVAHQEKHVVLQQKQVAHHQKQDKLQEEQAARQLKRQRVLGSPKKNAGNIAVSPTRRSKRLRDRAGMAEPKSEDVSNTTDEVVESDRDSNGIKSTHDQSNISAPVRSRKSDLMQIETPARCPSQELTPVSNFAPISNLVARIDEEPMPVILVSKDFGREELQCNESPARLNSKKSKAKLVQSSKTAIGLDQNAIKFSSKSLEKVAVNKLTKVKFEKHENERKPAAFNPMNKPIDRLTQDKGAKPEKATSSSNVPEARPRRAKTDKATSPKQVTNCWTFQHFASPSGSKRKIPTDIVVSNDQRDQPSPLREDDSSISKTCELRRKRRIITFSQREPTKRKRRTYGWKGHTVYKKQVDDFDFTFNL